MSVAADFDRMVAEFMADDPLTVVYIKQTTGDYDTTTREALVTTYEISVQAILLDLTLRTNGLSTEQNSLIQAGDKLLFVRPPEKTNPLASSILVNPSSDRIRIGNTTYKIVTFKESNPSAANQILIELYIRK